MTQTPRQAHRLATWRALREATVRLVAERGLAAVTVDDVVAAAGTSRRTFFNYFPTKAAALFDPDPELTGLLQRLTEEAPRTDDVWADACAICRAVVREGPGDLLVVYRRVAGSGELRDYPVEVHRHVEAALESWASGRLAGDALAARLVAATAGAALTSAFRTWDPATPPEEFARLADRALAAVEVHPTGT
ncbi:AcrR family transcriptional regulator [Geodermatophilus bullaregiensis]|uniref:TetR family transcriptional regulator n=1 Tax=Geodermatophilus bullaregiensis TaxID=1564160 RepID=UPI00195B5E38|nr:TetR family transcriptional regulator [Geodermatophilus bullaregiensis]MBM7805181.1 AcrR family transcriptional regulator [Geodermatophilus bullaregiensis]